MLECLIVLIVYVIIAVIVLWVLETVIASFGVAVPPPITTLIRLLLVLLVLIWFLNCIGLLGGTFHLPLRRSTE
jgi:hypothetical protein